MSKVGKGGGGRGCEGKRSSRMPVSFLYYDTAYLRRENNSASLGSRENSLKGTPLILTSFTNEPYYCRNENERFRS